MIQSVCILGSTGSIGQSTLDVIARHPDKMSVYALTAFSRMTELAQQAFACQAAVVVVPDCAARKQFEQAWHYSAPCPEIRQGKEGLISVATDTAVTTVMAAIVGAACLEPALAAAQAGKRILLANKESLVAAGHIFMQAVRDHGAVLLPIDSEHNAMYQCLPTEAQISAPLAPYKTIERLILTASGGPFREVDPALLANVTPDQACNHPNWSMGRKISVDSATMLNKGLEVIEAHWLFAMPADRIQVMIHPQSVVHSMVEYTDGSVLAQLGQPDMRTPIAYGLAYPDRIASGVGMMDLLQLGRLDFTPPDFARFPCLKLAFDALNSSQAACIALNAANEVAVDFFLNEKIRYTAIASIIEHTMEQVEKHSHDLASIEAVLALDAQSRQVATSYAHSLFFVH
ncbi:MAG TPA: 1-deoxy-D-xylulose-5-phosphate reductoisomerase [Paenalcaligenes hominis]|uniref:1-deoxy-D-xylulose 5-phosphate reductoisomerase n=1 Tax=Paenalcaligenes hominis TaxID=643674 RepID=A0A9D3AA54_9BURK|nr:1-deoxy-D-xylulose-5-phosphate reductoisomerase [Paenalcaligenes hominis]NJB64467.1 1-deoxy-D-xylulose-5-phosphate reductoisomerase [Paenalcaligenes hominis]GGE67422.1 1-deoxy-D-xylulose 5-phosphate reductoisomerase [Paenalcaligenes hominis]HJH23060.1 1-deoxy-D-xylulose-5-phosphate reductoisomerase [Paenalcaligenes hominis]